MEIEGKVALVTGASRGVGAAVAVALAGAGAKVACAARSTKGDPQKTPGTLDETLVRIAEVGGEGLAVPTDLAEEEEVVAMVQRTTDHFGRVDILVNNAGVLFFGGITMELKRFDLMFDINMRAPYVATREVAPGMKERGEGAIINVSSAAAVNMTRGCMGYGMAKIAIERMTEDLALQFKTKGVTANCMRIDMAVASEGYMANQPDADYSAWEPSETAADVIMWMLRQSVSYTGNIVSMREVVAREGMSRLAASA